ncbi:MAG: hypothetical protein Fur0040_07870 [Sideroxydans sp.]
MSPTEDKPAAPTDPSGQDDIQQILHKVIIAHQQALALLQQTEAAYNRLVPHQLLELLHARSIVDLKLGDQVERKMTILFADIRDFTPLSESMTPAENFEFINSYLSQMEPVISRHRGIIDKYIGDAIMALFEYSADDGVRGALAMLERLNHYNAGRARAGYLPVHIGIGINTGRVMIGTVGGINRMDSTVIGDPVNLAARLEDATKTYNTPLIISQNTLYDLADPTAYYIRFLDRVRVKGKSDPLSIHEVFDHEPTPNKQAKLASRATFELATAYYHLKEIGRALPLLQRCLQDNPGDTAAALYLEKCRAFQHNGRHDSTGELDTTPIWKPDYETGMATADSAHRQFVQHLTALTERIRTRTLTQNEEPYAFLEQHAATRFPQEEALMREQHYPFADAHAQEHQRFVQNFRALAQRLAAGQDDPLFIAFHTSLLMHDWLNAHVAKSDRHFTRFQQNQKRQQ